MRNPPILYEDSSCLVVEKPAGITVHPAPSEKQKTLIEILREHQPDAHLVHRLDKDTSGCLLIAKHASACEALQQQFKDHTVLKQYLALCAGVPAERQAIIDAPIGRNLVTRTKMSLFRTSTSKEAKTSYEVQEDDGEVSLLLCTPESGRTHQIRVHLCAIGHPILGDKKYGTEASKALTLKRGITRMCLHATALRFVSPATKKQVCINSPIAFL